MIDTVDSLYKAVTGGTTNASEAGAPPPPGGDMGGGAPPPPEPEAGGAPPIPESYRKDKNKLILESMTEDDFDEDEFLDFRKINESLGDMDDELSKLLGD